MKMTSLVRLILTGVGFSPASLYFDHARLPRLATHFYDGSRWYQDHLSRRTGLTRADLYNIRLQDLPILDRHDLHESFDEAVTDPRLSGALVGANLEGQAELPEGIRVLATSGSTDRKFVVPFYERDLDEAAGRMAVELRPRLSSLLKKRRTVVILATHGPFTGRRFSERLPRSRFDALTVSVKDPVDAIARQALDFKATQLIGYPSQIAELARHIVDTGLRHTIESVVLSGEVVTPSARAAIECICDPERISNLYMCTEGGLLGIQEGRRPMRLTTTLSVVELLDEADRPVPAGVVGRVVITNFFAKILPIIRYEMGDRATWIPDSNGQPALHQIHGRSGEMVNLRLDNGKNVSLHAFVFWDLESLGIKKMQVQNRDRDDLVIIYTAPQDLDVSIRVRLRELLARHRITHIHPKLVRVESIPVDGATGKHRFITR